MYTESIANDLLEEMWSKTPKNVDAIVLQSKLLWPILELHIEVNSLDFYINS